MARSRLSPKHVQLAQLLFQAREAAALTQAQLASRLQRPQSFVSNVESGERRVDVIELLEIAGAMGLDPAEVIASLLGSPPSG